jgi:2-hydroxy-6-oxo-6-(2'-carboxyphenyl)-hexa-2,4-dienoate hydrolase
LTCLAQALKMLPMQDPRFVDVDGIRTRYFEAGSGPPMVLVHGGSIGSSYNAYHWSLNFDELAKRFHVYALDKLGNGHTDNPLADADYTMAAVIAHVHGFLRTMQIENAVLVGHSRGALPVTRIAIDDPARCSALVILDTNTLAPEDPSTPSDFYRKLEVAPVESNEEYASREPIANSYSTAHMTDDFVQAAADVVALEKTWAALAKMKTLGGSTFQPDVRAQRADTLEMIAAGRLNVPMLIAWGLDDPSAPIKLGMDLLGIVGPALPHVRLHVFNRAGHYAFREHAAEMNRLIAAFVYEVEAR